MGVARDGPRRPSRGAIGGSSNEAGAAFRSGIAAWIITHGLRGRDLPRLQLPNNQAVPVMVALEADYPVGCGSFETTRSYFLAFDSKNLKKQALRISG